MRIRLITRVAVIAGAFSLLLGPAFPAPLQPSPVTPELIEAARNLPAPLPPDLVSKVKNRRRGYLIEARLIGPDAEPALPEDDYY